MRATEERLTSIIETLIEAVGDDPSPEVRAEAAQSLGMVGQVLPGQRPVVAEALLNALGDNHDLPRRAAAWALRRYIDEAVARHLLELLTDSPELWREVSTALAGPYGPDVEAALVDVLAGAPSSRSRRGAARALSSAHGFLAPDEPPLFGYKDDAGVRRPLF